LTEIINVQNATSYDLHQGLVGTTLEVLIESEAKKGNEDWKGRSEESLRVIFPKGNHQIGDLVKVKITRANQNTLIGESLD